MTDLGGKTCIFSHPVYLFLREFSLQDSRGGSVHSQQRLNSVARQLNERPRKTLDYESPAERFNKCLASIS
ncbi:hypothetical protein B6R23_17525 [Escherichia coli]|nr:hypothetical protein [Escherichia coli]EFO2627216.1 hypothetical protein [Escherichia coli]